MMRKSVLTYPSYLDWQRVGKTDEFQRYVLMAHIPVRANVFIPPKELEDSKTVRLLTNMADAETLAYDLTVVEIPQEFIISPPYFEGYVKPRIFTALRWKKDKESVIGLIAVKDLWFNYDLYETDPIHIRDATEEMALQLLELGVSDDVTF